MQPTVGTPTAPAVEAQSQPLDHQGHPLVQSLLHRRVQACIHFQTRVCFLPARLPSGWQCLEGRCQACPHLCCLSGLAVADAWECGRKSWGHSCVWVLVCSCVSAGKAWWFLYLSGSRASSREEHRYHFSFLIVPKPRFQTSTLFISDLVILCCRGCPVYCGLLSSVPELDLLDPSSIASQ